MKALFNGVLKYPKTVLLLLLALTVLAVGQMRHLYMETDIELMLPKTLDAYVNKQLLEERFGAADMIVIGVFNESEEGIYNPVTLAKIHALTDWLQTRREFQTLSMNDLLSLSTIKDIKGSQEGLEVEQFMESPYADAAAIANLKHRMAEFGLYEGAIVSKDGKATILAVKPVDDRYQYPKIFDLIQEKMQQLQAQGGSESYSGYRYCRCGAFPQS